MKDKNGKYKRIKNALLETLGVFDGLYAYKGPRCAQIDLTNRCNNNCIGCWCNSPLLEERLLPSRITDQTLPKKLVISLLDELSDMGTEEIYFAGGGEPFMHPDAMEIFSYAKQKGFHVSINTNFTLVDKTKAQRLVDEGVDHMIISIWAGTPAVYSRTHPNKTEETFVKIKEVLTFLNQYKESKGSPPVIKVYNVVFNLNYEDFENMIDFVIDTDSEAVEFTLIDTIPGKTDKLLLSKDQVSVLYETAKRVKARKDERVWLGNYDNFLRRLSSSCQDKGEYDRDVLNKVPCYAGWAFIRIIASGDVNSCLKSHRIPIGNLHKQSFRSLWNNSRQREFRKRTRFFRQDDPYFRFIGNDTNATVGCFRSCDNIGHSLLVQKNLERLNGWQKRILKTAAVVSRTGRSLCSRG